MFLLILIILFIIIVIIIFVILITITMIPLIIILITSQRISREEFHKGCALLNSNMSEDNAQRLTDIDHTLDLMDFDGSNDLDINEFFEVPWDRFSWS